METRVKLTDSKELLKDIRELEGKDFYIEIELPKVMSVFQMMAMVKRWRTVAQVIGHPIKIIAFGEDLEIDKSFQRLVLDDPISFSMLRRGDVMIE